MYFLYSRLYHSLVVHPPAQEPWSIVHLTKISRLFVHCSATIPENETNYLKENVSATKK